MRSDVFRKVSIDRLSSPEQLDQLMQITTPRGWAALAALFGLLGVAVAWSFLGRLPARVHGTGVLIRTGGVYDIVPMASGLISDIAVRPGELVREGQVVARVEQPVLVERIKQARQRLAELRVRHDQLERFGREDARLHADLLRQQQAALDASVRTAQEQQAWLRAKVESQRQLHGEGLVTRQALHGAQQQLHAAEEQVQQLVHERKQLSIQALTLANRRREAQTASRMEISALQREVRQMEEQLARTAVVASRYTGRILEVMGEVGGVVSQGRPLMRLDRVGDHIQDLEAVLYVAGADGKKIMAGMEVQIVPTTVRREEHGFMVGTVVQVSDFPATPEGMMRVLKNDQLVRVLGGSSVPYEVYASLKLDPETVSGYRWSSGSGPDMRIQSGTICTAAITIRRQRPVEMVLPALRALLGY